eukprot:gene1497-1983_t
MTDQDILRLFAEGKRERAFTKLYAEWPKVRRLVTKHGGSRTDARDIFHDALTILYQKIQTEQFTLTGSLGGFIYHTARNLWLAQLRREGKARHLVPDLPDTPDESDTDETPRLALAKQALEKLAEKCREILRLFYYERCSMEAIAKAVGLKGEQAAKTQKYKCLEAARTEFKTLNELEYLAEVEAYVLGQHPNVAAFEQQLQTDAELRND